MKWRQKDHVTARFELDGALPALRVPCTRETGIDIVLKRSLGHATVLLWWDFARSKRLVPEIGNIN
jgi:hypothetical protein